MRKKISLLTILAMFCLMVFGQNAYEGNYWKPNIGESSMNGTVTSVLSLDGVELTGENYEVGVFCGDNLKGSARLDYYAKKDRYYASIMIYTDQTINVTFKLYDHNLGVIYSSDQVLESGVNTTIGSAVNPYVINFTSVAKVGDVKFGNVIDAVNYAQAGQTVTLTNDSEITSTLVIDKNITLDLNGKSISQITDRNAVRVTSDNVVITDNSENGDGAIYCELFYAVTVGRNDQSDRGGLTINGGRFEGQTTSIYVACGELEIRGGEFSINEIDPQGYKYVINLLGNGDASALIYGGTFHNFNPQNNEADGANTNFCAEGYVAKDNGNNTYTVIADPSIGKVARIDNTYYATLVEAYDDAEDKDIVYLVRNAQGSGIVIDKDITIDFGGFTYSFTEPAVGSTGTQSNGFQILKGNEVTLQNGTLNVHADYSSKYYILVQNYADLNVIDMTLDGANLDKWSLTDGDSYVLSNNSGEVKIIGKTNIYANNDGKLAFAFDACDKSQYYELPEVTLYTTGIIDGAIEVSATLNIVAANLAERSHILIQDGGQLFHDGITATIKKPIAKSSGVYGAVTNWNTVSTPVEGGSDIQVAEAGRHDLYYYDEKRQGWRYQEKGKLISGKGYLYTNHEDVNFSFTGKLNTKAVEYTLSYTNGISLAGFNMIGNPFTHEISAENLTSTAQLAEGFYTITKEGGWQAQQPGETIAPLQSVLVLADQAATLTINPTAKATRNVESASLEITVNNSEYKDVAYVSFKEGLGLDKIEHNNGNIPMVFIPVNGKEYAIATMNSDVKEIPVAFVAKTMGQYTIAVNAKGCEYDEMYLIDRLTGKVTDLINDEYTFIATSNDEANRFVITFAIEETTGITENFVFVGDDEIVIEKVGNNGVVRIYDMLGRPVSEYNVNESARISTEAFDKGVYIIQMSDDNGVRVQKVVVD